MILANFFSWADRFESYLVENPEDRFSRDEAHMGKILLFTLTKLKFKIWRVTFFKKKIKKKRKKKICDGLPVFQK